MPSGLRVVVFGIRCAFTDAIVRGLVSIDEPPTALLLPGPPGSVGLQRLNPPRRALPMMGQSNAAQSNRPEVPTFNVGRLRHAPTVEAVADLQPDLLLVACYPTRIPAAIRDTARIAALNIHPSLLPRHRGPDPLFWTLREGTGEAGVTIHDLVDDLDAGPVVAQQAITYPNGTPEAQLEQSLATLAVDLLRDALPAFRRGSATRTRQDESLATYETWPEATDYIIDTDRAARSAFNFIRGIRERAIPVTIISGTQRVVVAEALAVIPHGGQVAGHSGDAITIPFSDAQLVVRPARIE